MTRIIHLKNASDIREFSNTYHRSLGGTDRLGILWRDVYKDYQGIFISPYCWASRFEFMWYYGWDCASACVWDLSAVKEIEGETTDK